MTVIIKRIDEDKYKLIDSNGEKITTYDTERMVHPDDWLDDARENDELVSGPYDWEYVDNTNISE